MTITHNLTLDLQQKGELQRINVVQGDAGTRLVEIELRSGGQAWEIPEQAQVAVRYLKPDGTAGVYDRLPDGTPAFVFSGNAIILELAPQMLTVAGAVQTQVELSLQECRIATFAFLIVVEHAVAVDGGSENYVNWSKVYLPQTAGAEQGQHLQITEVDAEGRVLGLAPVDDPAVGANQRMDVLENNLNAVGQRVEDASVDARDALVLASKAVAKPQTAEVGQILAVKAVAEDGYPTEWETVDLPEGSSGALYVTIDDNGDGTGAMDKTYEEVLAALTAGSPIIVSLYDTEGAFVGNALLGDGGGGFLAGSAVCADTTMAIFVYYVIISSGGVMMLRLPLTPETLPNPEKLTLTGAVETEYDGSAPVSIEIPAGGNAGVFRLSVTSEAASEAVTVDLPVAWGKVMLFNIHMFFGPVSDSFELQSSIGTSTITWGDVDSGSNVGANIHGMRYTDDFFALFFNQSMISHGLAMPSMEGKVISAPMPDEEASITFRSTTDGVLIPAGTTFELWGMYGQ